MFRTVLQSDTLVRFKHPTNALDGGLFDTAVSAVGQWFDDAKDADLLADVGVGEVILPVSHPERYSPGDLIVVKQNDLTFHESTINTIQEVSITLFTGPIVAADKGQPLARRFTGTFSLNPYGTPVAGETDWGFAGTHQSSQQLGLRRGMVIRYELLFDFGGGIDSFDWFNSKVVGPR